MLENFSYEKSFWKVLTYLDNLEEKITVEDLATLLNASIEYNLDAGHDMTLDDPKWVINKMKDFVS